VCFPYKYSLHQSKFVLELVEIEATTTQVRYSLTATAAAIKSSPRPIEDDYEDGKSGNNERREPGDFVSSFE